jgi:phenylpyruvate tautomerase PptA (4-oxalocrotonate tautomerase family)
MPLVRVSLGAPKDAEYRQSVSQGIYEAMRETLGIPEGDRFQVMSEHEGGTLVADPSFMGMKRSQDGFVLIQIFLSRGRSTEVKQSLYRRIAQRLAANPGVRPDDVMVVFTEVGLDDWSFGRGEAQYVLNPPAWAK